MKKLFGLIFVMVFVLSCDSYGYEITDDNEIAGIVGSGVINDTICGQCIDMCSDSGQSLLELIGACYLSTPPIIGCIFYGGQATDDACLSAGTIVHDERTSIYWCSYDNTGTGEEITCDRDEYANKLLCGTIDFCGCNDVGEPGGGQCDVITGFELRDQDECDPWENL